MKFTPWLNALLVFPLIAEEAPTRAQVEFFEKKIRPVLVNNCYQCHSHGKKIKGGLRLDTRDAIRTGGDTGPAPVAEERRAGLGCGFWIRAARFCGSGVDSFVDHTSKDCAKTIRA